MARTYRILVIVAATAALAVAVAWLRAAEGGWIQALCATWFVMVWVTSLRLLVPYELPDRYFGIRSFERSGRIYNLLAVPLLRRLVRRGPIHILAPRLQLAGRRESLPVLEREMRKAESAHGLSFVASLPLVAYALLNRWPVSAGWLLLFTFLLNIYPVMLQRDNRARLQRVLRRYGRAAMAGDGG